MLIKGICSNCAGHLEFEEENAGEKIDCPHCGFETALLAPGSEERAAQAAGFARKRTHRQRLIWGGRIALVLAVVFALYYWSLPIVKDFLPFPYGESKVWPVVVLVFLCFSAPFALAWLVMPVVLFLQLRQLIQKMAEIETHLRPISSEEASEAVPTLEATEESAKPRYPSSREIPSPQSPS